MEGSSDSPWHKSDNSRGLNTSLSLLRSNSSGSRNERDSSIRNRDGLSGVCQEHEEEEQQQQRSGIDPFVPSIEWGDISLRQWLDKPDRSVDSFECLHIFKQILEIVNVAHSHGIVVHNVKPSCFVMSSFNHVSFIESASCSDSGSDSPEDGLNSLSGEGKRVISTLPSSFSFRPFSNQPINALSETTCMHPSSLYAARASLIEETEQHKNKDRSNVVEEKKQSFPMKRVLVMENSWYTSPEEGSSSLTCASDVYQLGVLLFELFCPFSSREEKSRTMSSLRHRVLPPQLLLKWPKEASFCLWLLHPDPTCRPKLSELLQSEFLNESRDNLEECEAAIELKGRIEEQELLLEFLLLIQQRKQEAAHKLQDTISFLCSDIEEVMKHQNILGKKSYSCPEFGDDDQSTSTPIPSMNITENDESALFGSRKRFRPGRPFDDDNNTNDGEKSDTVTETEGSSLHNNSRLMDNFKKLESVYFMMRCRPTKPSRKPLARLSSISSDGRGSIVLTERSSDNNNNMTLKERYNETSQGGWISPFLEGLCKYQSFSKLRVKADLKQGDLLNSSNLVCSLGFDRDGEFFATAGVNRKIKVFECDSVINEDRDIHYPVVEMATRSKLSNICWNKYIKSQIASSNFEGVVQVWDVARSQMIMEMREHERRVWSIDFSSADPTMLASGSDDGSVKLWSINQAILNFLQKRTNNYNLIA